MFRKKSFLPLTSLCCLFSAQASASTVLFNSPSKHTDLAIVSLYVKASHEVFLKSVKIYASVNGCSDLAKVGEMHWNTLDPGLNLTISDDLVSAEQMFSPARTPWKCLREDVTSTTGVQQTIGPIKLTWDAGKQRFNQAVPSYLTVNFD